MTNLLVDAYYESGFPFSNPGSQDGACSQNTNTPNRGAKISKRVDAANDYINVHLPKIISALPQKLPANTIVDIANNKMIYYYPSNISYSGSKGLFLKTSASDSDLSCSNPYNYISNGAWLGRDASLVNYIISSNDYSN